MKISGKSLRTILLAATAAVVVAASAGVATAAKPTATGPVAVPITPAQSGGVLDGVFTITSFTIDGANQLVANGTFAGTSTVNGVTQTVESAASAPVADEAAGGSCQILDLLVNPLHLDLLGLVVDLQAVHLNITAQQGPGQLLGNLLCALTGILDNVGQPTGTGLLNRVNTILAG